MTRPGFGEPHPHLAALLKGLRPLATQRTTWANGTVPLEIGAYDAVVELPDELVTSVRCIVRVADQFVLCTNEVGVHPLPGGRREPGESYLDTAIREVHEETGWLLEHESLRPLGWLHFRHLGPHTRREYPYPDFLQRVFAATAKQRDCAPDTAWTDSDGWEQSSSPVSLDEALARTAKDPLASVFLRLAARALPSA